MLENISLSLTFRFSLLQYSQAIIYSVNLQNGFNVDLNLVWHFIFWTTLLFNLAIWGNPYSSFFAARPLSYLIFVTNATNGIFRSVLLVLKFWWYHHLKILRFWAASNANFICVDRQPEWMSLWTSEMRSGNGKGAGGVKSAMPGSIPWWFFSISGRVG